MMKMVKLSAKETIKVLENIDEILKKDKSFVTTGDHVEYIGDKYPELRKNVGYPVSSAFHGGDGKTKYAFTTKDEAPGLYDSDQFEKITDKKEFLERLKNISDGNGVL